MSDINESKIAAKIVSSKSVKDLMQFSATSISTVLSPQDMVDSVARLISSPEFLHADNQLEWLIGKIEAITVAHLTEQVKNPLVRIQLAYNLASLANMTVGDIVPEAELTEEASHE